MSKIKSHKSQVKGYKSKAASHKLRCLKMSLFLLFVFTCDLRLATHDLFAQQTDDLTFTLDANSPTVSLPKIFKPNIDLSGRGLHRDVTWPQSLAAASVLDAWGKDIGFNGVYRLQYNLWEINQLAKDKDTQDKLLNNYEDIIKKITEAGGIVILDIFSTPAGLGQALDKKSAPWDYKAFKALIKSHVKELSCNKRYNIWYEVWSAPDLDDFFLGRKQEYLNLYRTVAEVVKELSQEHKMYIPVGGPATSWWFQNLDANSIITPERSLIYELIKFCFRYHLPLDFITWHAYSTDPKAEKESTIYKKTGVKLVRDWLSYFNFDSNIPLIIDEWNYDSSANVLPERQEKSFIAGSFIPSRIKNMYEAGINYQLYFCLEDFQNNKEGVVRNTGVFNFDSEASEYKGTPKAIYNVFRMFSSLGDTMFTSSLKINDEFVNVIATKGQDRIIMLIYNYIDPEAAKNYLSRNIASFNGAQRKSLLKLITSGNFDKVMLRQLDISKMRLSKNLKAQLKKAQDLNDKAVKFSSSGRNINTVVKNLKGDYLYQRYVVDSSCSVNCAFVPVEEQKLNLSPEPFQKILTLNPYSVQMIILSKKPPEVQGAANVTAQEPADENIKKVNNVAESKEKVPQESIEKHE